MRYNVKIEPQALSDIQEITNWYNKQKAGLGKRFQTTAIKQISSLSENPHIYAVRYKKIRCFLINKFPYITHFHINEESRTIEILAVINTSRSPKIWTDKTGK